MFTFNSNFGMVTCRKLEFKRNWKILKSANNFSQAVAQAYYNEGNTIGGQMPMLSHQGPSVQGLSHQGPSHLGSSLQGPTTTPYLGAGGGLLRGQTAQPQVACRCCSKTGFSRCCTLCTQIWYTNNWDGNFLGENLDTNTY
jgi:hypothetical protein